MAVLWGDRVRLHGMEMGGTGLHQSGANLGPHEAGLNPRAWILPLDPSYVDPLSGEMAF